MMRAIFLLLLAGGAEGRKALFGQTGGDGNKCGAACEWFASAPVDGNADATCGNRVQYLMDEGDDAITACGQVATEAPKICGGCACGVPHARRPDVQRLLPPRAEEGPQFARLGHSGQLLLGGQPRQLEVARCTEITGHDT